MSRAQPANTAVPREGQPTRRQLRRRILGLAGPVMVEQVMASATQIVDMIMIGQLGPAAVASVGLSFQPFMFVFAVFMGLAVGTTAVVARHVGAGEREAAGRAAAQSVILAAGLGLLIAVPAYILAPSVVRLMGAEPDVVAFGTIYIRNLVWGVAFILMSMLLGGALRGAGDTRTPMKVALAVNLFNVIGNWVLIFGNLGFPALGIRGAALATSIARAGGGLALLLLVLNGRVGLRFSLRDLVRLRWPLVRRIARVGVPAGGERVIMGLAQMLFARTVASLGTVPFAAHVIALNAESVAYMPATGFATAASTTVGQCLGARRPDLAREYGRECKRLTMGLMAVIGLILFIFPHYLIRLYSDDPEVIRLGVMCLRIMAPAQVFQGIGFTLGGALRGAGDTRRIMLITVVGVWGFRLGLSLVLVLGLGIGLAGAWIAMGVDWAVRSAMLTWRFSGREWERIRV